MAVISAFITPPSPSYLKRGIEGVLLFAIFFAASLASADEIRLLHFDTRSGAQAFVSAHPESAATNVVSGPGGGSMVWVSGPEEPPATEGMTVLGTSYAEVFGDPDRRALYDSVFPPGHYDAEGGFVETPGEERRFGMFAGREEMQ